MPLRNSPAGTPKRFFTAAALNSIPKNDWLAGAISCNGLFLIPLTKHLGVEVKLTASLVYVSGSLKLKISSITPLGRMVSE